MKRVIGIGNALVDIMTRLDSDELLISMSFPKGSMQLVDGEMSSRIKESTSAFVESLATGGSVANTIHGLAMLGAGAGYIGSVGADSNGEFFEREMRNAGVSTHLFKRDEDTGTAVAMITPDSERTFATHLGAATELSAGDLSPVLFDGYGILYLEGYLINNIELVRETCRLARAGGLMIAIDLSSFNVVEAYKGEFNEIVDNFVDIIFANEEEARSFTGLEPEEALDALANRCELAIVKTGKQGSLIKRGEEKIRVGSLTAKSIDTTGAGDLYAAGFLYGLASGDTLDRCGWYGTLLAGNVIEVYGPKMDDDRWHAILHEIDRLRKED